MLVTQPVPIRDLYVRVRSWRSVLATIAVLVGAVATSNVALSVWSPLSLVPWISVGLWFFYAHVTGRMRVLRDGLAFTGPFVQERFVPFSAIEQVSVRSAFIRVREELVVLTTRSGASITFSPWQALPITKPRANETTVRDLVAVVEARVAEARASRSQVDALGLATKDGESLHEWAKRILASNEVTNIGPAYRAGSARPSKNELVDLLARADVEPRVRVAAASLLGLRDEVPEEPIHVETDLPRLRVALERASGAADAEALEHEVAALEKELRVGTHER